MPSSDLRFDFRDLAAAAIDSCGSLLPLFGHLFERAAVVFEFCLLARKSLPALQDDVNILRVELDSAADPLREFRGGQRCPAAKEGLVHQLPTLYVVQDWAPHEIDRLLSGVVILLFVGAAHDELGRGRCPNRGVLAGLPEPGSVLPTD